MAAPMAVDGASLPPSPTIYINNLYEKINKQELKKCLYAMFSQFGRILDVVCLKTLKMRGQAWIVFTDVAAATNALRTMQGFQFFNKPIRIQYAKTKSDAIAKLDGTIKLEKERRKKAKTGEPAKKGPAAAPVFAAGGGSGAAAAAPAPAAPDMTAPPNKILFVQGLPADTTDSMVAMLFKQFPGFKEVRMVESHPGIAFVEYDNEMQSSVALSGLQGFKISPTNAMVVSYVKS